MNHPTIIAEYSSRFEAESARNLLESFGVICQIVADDVGGLGPGQAFIHGVKILVDVADVATARQLLDIEA